MTRDEYPLHDSIRGWFGRELYMQMQDDLGIDLITADLGYGLFSRHQQDFPNQVYNFNASEQAALGAAIGMTLAHRTCFVYSITTFLLWRGAEWLRNYVNHENIPVRLVGSGFKDDYKHDGFTHQSYDAKAILALFPRVKTYFPESKEEVPHMVKQMIEREEPSFICLRR